MTWTAARLALFVTVGLGYAAGSQLAFSWFGADGTNASFFPAAGVSVAALVLAKRRDWPIVLVAAGVAELVVDLLHDISLEATAGYVVANLTQPLVAVVLLLTVVHRRVDLGRSEHLAAFIACAVVAGPAVGAALGATTFVVIDDGTGWATFAGEWWVGDGLGVLVVAGTILALRSPSRPPPRPLWLTETVVLVAVAAFATFVVFRWHLFPFAYVPILILVASAFRLGTAGVALGGAAVAFVAAQATAEGHTIWESLDVSASTGLLYLQLALGVAIATTLVLAAEIHEREDAARSALDRARDLQAALDASERAGFLARFTGTLERPTTVAGRARRAVELLTERHATGAAVYMIDETQRAARLARSGGDATTWEVADPLVQEAVGASGGSPAALDAALRSAEAVVAVPLIARKRTLGVLALTGGELAGDQALLREVAERTAFALDNAQLYEQERQVSHTLQHGLLGGPLPQFEGIELASAYRSASDTHEVGGDWYDAFSLPGGRIALVVGDVVGHGLDAAIAMGQLRGAVRALAPAHPPAEVLQALDVFVAELPAASMATLAYVQLDPASGIARFACAGHPPPLLSDGEGNARYLWDGRSGPLGVRVGAGRPEAAVVLGTGDTILLYTDGLVEKRGTSLDDGLDGLLSSTRRLVRTPFAQLVDRLLGAMVHADSQDDDVCLILARCSPTCTQFRHVAEARLSELAPLRHALRAWLDDLDIDATAVQDTVLAVGEAAANAIEHGHGADGAGRIAVDASAGQGEVLVVVRDSGRWLDRPPDPLRGRGTRIMQATMDSMVVHTGPTGTEVRLHRRM